MYYCKDFNSLSVLSLYEGELLGVVDKLYFDKKIKKLCEIELISSDGVRMVLPTKNIYNVGKNAITVKNNQSVVLKAVEKEFCLAPIGSKVYSITGEFLGIVEEISFNDKYLTEKVSLDNGQTLELRNMASCGKNAVIFYKENCDNVSLNRFSPKQPKMFKRKVNQETNTMPIANNEELPTVEVKQPTTQNANFLVGRVCTKDIFNFNNELLIKAHTVITKKNLKEINKFGKLRELMVFSK